MGGARFAVSELQDVTAGRWVNAVPAQGDYGVSTDTRQDGSGKVFFALSGENFDAHDFLDKAVLSGCAALCIKADRIGSAPAQIPLLAVDDPLTAMQKLAAYPRRRFDVRIAAVTGSVGKTSVKEMLRAIFTEAVGEDRVLYTIGNTNNHIGVPQNLFRLNPEHRYAVIECGTSSPGEIRPLSLMASPDAAVINSIAPCHLEKLIDLCGVAAEKSEIFAGLSPDGIAVIPAGSAGNDILTSAAEKFRCFRFGQSSGECRAEFKGGSLTESCFTLHFPDGSSRDICWQLAGIHQCSNAAAAAAAAFGLGIEADTIAAGLVRTVLPGMRMKRVVIDGVTYINDAYNANPASMKAVIELLKNHPEPDKLILLLGGMRELGDISESEHRKLLAMVREVLPQAKIITIGREFSGMNDPHFDKSPDAEAFLQSAAAPGFTVFAKGSNGNHVELALPQEVR